MGIVKFLFGVLEVFMLYVLLEVVKVVGVGVGCFLYLMLVRFGFIISLDFILVEEGV